MLWQALLDGLAVLSEKWTVVLACVCIAFLGGSLRFIFTRAIFADRSDFWQTVLIPGGFFGVSVLFRLAFLTKALVPPYFDSVEHYRIINELVIALKNSDLLETIPTLTPSYYHLGFHYLAALLAFGLQADPIDVILVLGQVILAAIPIPVYFLIRHETHSDLAAFFGMLLAGFGWYMPGFAVNWGKYPALAGMLAFEIILISAYLIARNKSPRYRTVSIIPLFLGITVSTLFHTRTLILLAISAMSWLIAGRIRTLLKSSQLWMAGALLAGALAFGVSAQTEPLLDVALDPYLGNGLPVTLTVVALSLFALVNFPRGYYFSILFISGVLVALFIPIDIPSLGLENQTLLDRPFVEMALYLPLSILAGLGLAGIQQRVNEIKSLSEKMRLSTRVSVSALLVGFAGIMPIASYNFYPSDCCIFVKYDDTVALDWITRNTPPDARILIAATRLNVFPSGPSENLVGADAGIWVSALTGRTISLLLFDTDFRSASTLIDLCRMQIGYIYIGGTEYRFNPVQLQAHSDWYKRMLHLPNAQLYKLTGC